MSRNALEHPFLGTFHVYGVPLLHLLPEEIRVVKLRHKPSALLVVTQSFLYLPQLLCCGFACSLPEEEVSLALYIFYLVLFHYFPDFCPLYAQKAFRVTKKHFFLQKCLFLIFFLRKFAHETII